MTACRICGSVSVSEGGQYRPYSDFETTLYDCRACGCRFANRDEFVYEQLHQTTSSYAAHKSLGNEAKHYFDRRDLQGLERFLGRTPKNRFVIDQLNAGENGNRVLEFGCSRGYLSAYPILMGKEFYGVDVSETAVAAARSDFGEHFYTEHTMPSFADRSFDLIYHVGTVGCVEDPIGFIRKQVALLRSGGMLLFNAPNLDACHGLGLPWLSGATPPDLVTIFPPDFWKKQFASLGEVTVIVARDTPLVSYLRRRSARTGSAQRKLFEREQIDTATRTQSSPLRRAIKWFGRYLPPIGPFSRLPQEFGVYVRIQAR